jgi:hypothetical protein
MGIKILAIAFALLALRRLILRYRSGGTMTLQFVVWLLLFSGIGVVVFIPQRTDQFAHWMGVSSGFNLLTFIAITGLLFSAYRLLVRVQSVERDLTRAVRAQALATATRVEAKAKAPPAPPAAAS